MEHEEKAAEYGGPFSMHYRSAAAQSLTVVCGHTKAGKSVCIDLLAGEELILYEDVNLMTNVVVNKNNCAADYPAIHTALLPAQRGLLLEGFTLEPTSSPASEVLKLVFLREMMREAKQAAFVVLLEDSQHAEILSYVEYFLGCLGVTGTDRHPRIDAIKQCLYLLFTKAEEKMSEETITTIKELAADSENENVKEIINYLLKELRIEEFRNEEPNGGLAATIRGKFQPKPFDFKIFEGILKDSVLIQEKEAFSEAEQASVLDLLGKTTELIAYLILFAASQERSHERKYEELAKSLYSTEKAKREPKTMMGKLNRAAVASLSIAGKVSALDKKKLEPFAQTVIGLLGALQPFTEAKRDLEDIAGKLTFFTALTEWFSPSTVQAKAGEAINFYKTTLLELVSSIEKEKQKADSPSPSPSKQKPVKAGTKPASKKGNPAFNAFRTSILQRCSTNREALQACVSAIKSKERQANYDYFDVIYYIKLLKDLLEEFDSRTPSEHCLFVRELMELALYLDDYFDFQRYLNNAIRTKSIPINEAKTLMVTLKNAAKYDLAERLIDYILAETTQIDAFERLAQFKANLKALIARQYFQREGAGEGKAEPKRRELKLAAAELVGRRGKGSELEAYLAGTDFERHLGGRE